jgi:hypothetical protein
MPFAFEKLNLTRNPFGEPTREERMELALVQDQDHAQWVQWLQKPNRAIQFMGDQGRGKSTHLFALLRSFPGAPFTYLAEGVRFVRIPRFPVVFVDEVQRLHPLWRFFLELHGAHIEVLTREVSVMSLAKLAAILTTRIEWARQGPGPVPTLPDAALRALKSRFGSDLRAMEGHLYDVFQALRKPGPVTLNT